MAGFVHFDPDKWQPPEREAPPAKPANVANPDQTLAALATLAGSLDGDVRSMMGAPPPRRVDPIAWQRVVDDALRLLDDGWAAKAMALGWSTVEIFGAVPDPAGDPAGDGLAVWMAGRKLLALTGEYAVVDDGGGGRSYFNRREAEGVVLLWELGRTSRAS